MPGRDFDPLKPEGVERIQTAALDDLETIGILDAPDSGIKMLTDLGGNLWK